MNMNQLPSRIILRWQLNNQTHLLVESTGKEFYLGTQFVGPTSRYFIRLLKIIQVLYIIYSWAKHDTDGQSLTLTNKQNFGPTRWSFVCTSDEVNSTKLADKTEVFSPCFAL